MKLWRNFLFLKVFDRYELGCEMKQSFFGPGEQTKKFDRRKIILGIQYTVTRTFVYLFTCFLFYVVNEQKTENDRQPVSWPDRWVQLRRDETSFTAQRSSSYPESRHLSLFFKKTLNSCIKEYKAVMNSQKVILFQIWLRLSFCFPVWCVFAKKYY